MTLEEAQALALNDPGGRIKMAVVPVETRPVQGPKSYTIYNFNPYAYVENRDLPDMVSLMISTGCACNHNQRTVNMFATETDILSGAVVPSWAGQYGAPPIKKGA